MMNESIETKRVVIGISGASGAVYGVRLLERLASVGDVQAHLVITEAAKLTLRHELDRDDRDVAALADVSYAEQDVGASIASGSFLTAGMIVAPCSMRTLSAIANSFADNLLVRAADVCLKERRVLVLMVRETPLHLGHLRLMTQAAEAGAIILPPVPGFYRRPETIEQIVDHSIARALDLLGIHLSGTARWHGLVEESRDVRRD